MVSKKISEARGKSKLGGGQDKIEKQHQKVNLIKPVQKHFFEFIYLGKVDSQRKIRFAFG